MTRCDRRIAGCATFGNGEFAPRVDDEFLGRTGQREEVRVDRVHSADVEPQLLLLCWLVPRAVAAAGWPNRLHQKSSFAPSTDDAIVYGTLPPDQRRGISVRTAYTPTTSARVAGTFILASRGARAAC